MGERRLDEHDPNPLSREPYPVLVLDERDGVSVPFRERDALVHWHDDLQLIVVTQGVMDIDTPIGHFDCGAGQAALVNSGVAHRAIGRVGSVCTSFVFPASLLGFASGSEMYARAIAPYTVPGAHPAHYFDRSEPWHSGLIAHLDAARTAALFGDGSPVAHYRVAVELASSWAIYIENIEPGGGVPADIILDKRIRAFVGYIEEHYVEPVTIEDIARAADVSKAECGRCFRRALGTTPYAYLTDYRIRCAADMILEGAGSMTQIAHACGFGSSGHFSKTFKNIVGMSPKAYKSNHLAGRASRCC